MSVAKLFCFESATKEFVYRRIIKSSMIAPIRWTYLYQIGNWIDNRQLVAGLILNRQPATSCKLLIFVELILSVSNLNRQPATSCQLPIRWTCLYRIGNWISNRQLVASCRFVELILSVSNLNRQPATSWRFIELVCIESTSESATGDWLPVADSLNFYCLFRIWIGNLLPFADSLNLSVSNLNRQPVNICQLPIRLTCLFWIGNWIGNPQLVACCRFVELFYIESATESATGN